MPDDGDSVDAVALSLNSTLLLSSVCLCVCGCSFKDVMAAKLRLLYSVSRPGKTSQPDEQNQCCTSKNI